MYRITWLMEQFQFTYRHLGKLLHVPASILHRFHHNKRKLPVRSQGLLDHPLFAPYPIREEMANLPEQEWEDPDKEIRFQETEARRINLFLEKIKTSKQLQAMKDRRVHLQRILYHTRNLPFTFEGGESLVELKWIYLRSLAREELASITLVDRRKLEKKIVLIDAEMKWLQEWLDENGGARPLP